jgi:HK97 family phage major capsid protein
VPRVWPRAGTKPESTLGLTTTDEPIKKIATMLPVSEEMLEDAPAIQSYINGRLGLFVRLEEERQLIRGTSGGNEVQGLLTSRSSRSTRAARPSATRRSSSSRP